jgi:hypothetical protein
MAATAPTQHARNALQRFRSSSARSSSARNTALEGKYIQKELRFVVYHKPSAQKHKISMSLPPTAVSVPRTYCGGADGAGDNESVCDAPDACTKCYQCVSCSAAWRHRVTGIVAATKTVGHGHSHVVQALVQKGCCMACVDPGALSRPFIFSDTTRPPMRVMRGWDELAAQVTPEDLVLLDVDETVLSHHYLSGATWLPADLPHLLTVLRTAKYVMFVTARAALPAAWDNFKRDLDALGVAATEDHVLFTGDVRKGQYVRTALAARGLCDAPGWFVDDNAEAVRSVYRCMPRLQCVQFRGGFVRPVAGAAGVEPAVVLPPLPPLPPLPEIVSKLE